jgi:ribosomal protein S18 acetylase RimI-like enzyme
MNWKFYNKYGYIKYETEYGRIIGYQHGEYFKVTDFLIHPQYRGKGKARELAKNIPLKAKLQANPTGPGLNLTQLVKFYESLGFKIVSEAAHNCGYHMIRG